MGGMGRGKGALLRILDVCGITFYTPPLMQRSSIEWTDVTWNPMRGCTEISPGCDHCYARTFAERFRGVPGHPYEDGFDFHLAPHKLHEPLSISKQRMVFVNSMSDLFYCKVPTEYIRDIAEVMLNANWHVYQVLTKRSKRMKQLLNSKDPVFREAAQAPHIWWGVSAEDKKHGHPRIRHLQETHAAVRWISFEPLLEDITPVNLEGINWAVVGGESGVGARLMDKQSVLNIKTICNDEDIPFHFKQWGGVHKKKTGRKMNGRIYNALPEIVTQPVPIQKQRRELIADVRRRVAEVWKDHELSVDV